MARTLVYPIPPADGQLFEAHRGYRNRQVILYEYLDNIYWFSTSDVNGICDVYKSTDRGASWAIQDIKTNNDYGVVTIPQVFSRLYALGVTGQRDYVRIGNKVWSPWLYTQDTDVGTNGRKLRLSVFNLETDTWDLFPTSLGPFVYVFIDPPQFPGVTFSGVHTMCSAGGNKLFIAFHNTGDTFRRFECVIYDIDTDTWSSVYNLVPDQVSEVAYPISCVYDSANNYAHVLWVSDTKLPGDFGLGSVNLHHVSFDITSRTVVNTTLVATDVTYGVQTDWPPSLYYGTLNGIPYLSLAYFSESFETVSGILREKLYAATYHISTNTWNNLNIPFPTDVVATDNWTTFSVGSLRGTSATAYIEDDQLKVYAATFLNGQSWDDPNYGKVYLISGDGITSNWTYFLWHAEEEESLRKYWALVPVRFSYGDFVFAVTDFQTGGTNYQEAYLLSPAATFQIAVADTMNMGDTISVVGQIEGGGTIPINIDECPDIVASGACSFVKTINDSETPVTDCEETVFSESGEPCHDVLQS